MYMQQKLATSCHQMQVYGRFLNILIYLPHSPGRGAGPEYVKSNKYNSIKIV